MSATVAVGRAVSGGKRTLAPVVSLGRMEPEAARSAGVTLICKICDHFWNVVSARSDAWERAASNEDQLISEESDQSRDLIERAAEIEETDPSSAFQLYRQAAEAGSVWSLEKIGWHYWTGTGVAADPHLALEYYHRAICGGSWIATIHYARLLAELGHYDLSERTLENGVASDFVPAYYWLAWYRYERSETTKVCREVRPLLEYAAEKGHPRAKLLLARWMVLGKFGLRHIPRGFRLVVQAAASAFRPEYAPAS
jgi:TPR repeat protein